VFIAIFASLLVSGRWDQASWWRPIGYFGVYALFLLVAALLLLADIYVGVRLRRAFRGRPR